MASTFIRSATRTSLSSLRTHVPKPKPKPASAKPPSSPFGSGSAASPSPTRRFASLTRSPVELASCVGSMFPLHSAVAAARLTSRLSTAARSCRDLSQGTLCRTYPGL